jgi:type IV secretory pathway VirB4 component
MKELDAQLDDHPELSLEIVELDNRNRLAHKELQVYNDHRIFLCKHPLTTERKQYDDLFAELNALKRTDPAALLTEITNLVQNIRRIRSNLAKQKYKSDEEKQSLEKNLSRAELRKKVIEEVIRT